MEHYISVKEKHPDAVVMYRLGDFYEMFFEDAKEVSKLLDLTLTGRDCGLEERAPMCGVPYHAADSYVAKLVKLGKKVAICEQLTTPQDQKGMVERDVIRIITPGTVTDDEMLEGALNNYLASVCVKGAKCAVAYADVSTGEIKAVEISAAADTVDEFLLALSPSETLANGEAYSIIKSLETVKQGRLVRPQAYYDYSFDYDNAAKSVTSFYKTYSLDALGLSEGNTLAVCALGALLEYIESTQKRTLSHFLTPKILRPGKTMFLDYNTKKNLELLETLSDKAKKGSLLSVLDHTRTNMGARLIRKWITEPLQTPAEINRRLDAVEELIHKKTVSEQLGIFLSNVRDVERLCNKIAYNNINPRECRAIVYSLRQIPLLKNLLVKMKSAALIDINNRLDTLDGTVKLIESAISENPPVALKDGGVIKTGYNEELDTYREAGTSGKKWIAEYEAKEREQTGLKTLKVGFNRVFGYYIEVSNSYLNQVPYRFERKQTLSTGERFITAELKKTEELILGAEENALKLEEKLYSEIKTALSAIIKPLQENAGACAELDVLFSFSQAAAAGNYCRPSVSEKGSIVIKEGRHPVVEALKGYSEFVPNDTVMDDSSRTLIVTGPNMAGKSTYMRQTALIVLMAHIGSFVPAKSAEICIADRIFTRVGASDNLAFGQSTFMVEMTEVANILNNATANSLLILDEIGRGTSTLDGLSIAWAVVEHVSLKIKAKTLFATHYHELSELETVIPSLKNYHVLIKEDKNGITFLYKIARGGASKSFGIEVASLAGVNRRVIDRAGEIMAALDESHKVSGELNKKITATASQDAIPTAQIGFFEEQSAIKEVEKALLDIDIDSCTPIQALTLLADFKKKITFKRKKS